MTTPVRRAARWLEAMGSATRDCTVLVIAVVLSMVGYIHGLGFYSDDWAFLRLLDTSPDQSFAGLVHALYDGDVIIRQRPLQIIYLAGLYTVFDAHPLGYHLVNGGVIVATSVVLYLCVRELQQPRQLAFAVAAIYALLPHYSSDRFWVAAFQAPLCIVFYVLNLYATLRAFRDAGAPRWSWISVGALSAIASGLAYEVAMPLILLNGALVLYRTRQRLGATNRTRGTLICAVAVFLSTILPVTLVAGYKALVTVRTGIEGTYAEHVVVLATGAVRVNYGTYGIGLPYVLAWIVRHEPDWQLISLSGMVALGVYGYLSRVAWQPAALGASRAFWYRLMILGLSVFALGYVVFLTNDDVWFTSTSLGNRISIAAAGGVALTMVAVIGWLSSHMSTETGKKRVFASGVAVLGFVSVLIVNTLGTYWVVAYEQQQAVVRDIYEHVGYLPSGSVLLLDGVCLEHGGAYVFTGQRDLASRLILTSRDPTLWAIALSHRPVVQHERLVVQAYETFAYPYSERLLVYDYRTKSVHPLPDADTAQRYFSASGFDPEEECPPGFAWGWNTQP